MTQPLEGKLIALAEGRQLQDLVRLLEAEGAVPLSCPMFAILDSPDVEAVDTWLHDLIAGQFTRVILMTGEAVRRLHARAQQNGLGESFTAALGKTWTLTRGPKPGQALKELGLTPSRVAPKPTTEGVLAALKDEPLAGTTIGFTLYGEPNPVLESFLISAGATARAVLSYVYAPATEDAKIVDLIHRLDRGEVAAIIFTSSPQIERLFEVAIKNNLEATLRHGLMTTRIAAVGPVVAETLNKHKLQASICPEQGFQMKNLVQHLKRAFSEQPGIQP